jgi:hypothetical protein
MDVSERRKGRVVEVSSGAAIEVAGQCECDICGQEFLKGEKVIAAGGEVTHAACVAHWFKANFGKEGLA